MPNRLINEKSPYLLQHAHNPVDWHPWGDAAFETARQEDKPVFLSVGYATCHWCHVMERESFEDAQAAEALNRNFVCIKVDREERPDIDAVYMAACHLVTGSGGWPLTIVMTPDKRPFFAGTYLPKESFAGRIGLLDLCAKIGELWRLDRNRVTTSADVVSGHLESAFAFEAHTDAQIDQALIDRAASGIVQRFDSQYGGFDSAPKFPMAHRLIFLLNQHARTGDNQYLDTTARTLEAMRQGGIWDHVGFGFHRYATDRQWLLPHFEKMLYDQALLAMAYLKGYQATGRPLFSQTAREIFTYVLRDMTDAAGGFYTAEDADSEGEEGKCYLWSQAEFEHLCDGSAGDIPWAKIFNLHPEGNFLEEATRQKTGTNILHLTKSWDEWAQQLSLAEETLRQHWELLRQRLFAQRAGRIPPLKDDKILTDWNGLMIAALASGATVLGEPAYVEAAGRSAAFLLDRMTDGRAGLLHRFREGEAVIAATANDYTYLIMGLTALHDADSKAGWLDHATRLQAHLDELFWDPSQGGYFLTSREQADLPVRPKEGYDGAMPSANGVALNNLMALHRLTGDGRYRDRADQLIRAFGGSVRKQPAAYLHMINGWMALER